jgi:phosphatidylglycerophosphatase C
VPAPGIAAFDFDGTITSRDTLVPFLARLAGWRRLGLALLRTAPALANANRRDVAKLAAIRAAFADREALPIRAAGAEYALALPDRYRPEIVERIAAHRHAGHRLVLVTASLGLYARPAAAALGFHDVIAVDLIERNGAFTGGVAGPNIRGHEKARRLRNLMGDATGPLWAYGNSAGDRDLLALADFPHWVRRRAGSLPPLYPP